MGAADSTRRATSGISLHDLRPLVGAEVAADTVGGPIEGTLLSCTTRSAWIVVDDVDHVVAAPPPRRDPAPLAVAAGAGRPEDGRYRRPP